MHISFTILAALGLAASAHSTTNKRQPSKYEACTNPGFEWCDQGEMVACKKGYVAGLQKRCATKRQAEINDTCFNYGTQWCDDDGECLTCKKVANVEQGRVIRINKRRGVKKRGIGSWCDNIGRNNALAYEDGQLISHRRYVVSRLQDADLHRSSHHPNRIGL
jgi:hypothetical protein